eukprot:807044-Amphidinium_carterae.2
MAVLASENNTVAYITSFKPHQQVESPKIWHKKAEAYGRCTCPENFSSENLFWKTSLLLYEVSCDCGVVRYHARVGKRSKHLMVHESWTAFTTKSSRASSSEQEQPLLANACFSHKRICLFEQGLSKLMSAYASRIYCWCERQNNKTLGRDSLVLSVETGYMRLSRLTGCRQARSGICRRVVWRAIFTKRMMSSSWFPYCHGCARPCACECNTSLCEKAFAVGA